MQRIAGFSLHEVLVTLVIASIAMSIAVPRLEGFIRRERVRGAMNRLAGDLEYTRIAAIRHGRGASLRFVPDARCAGRGGGGYVVEVRGTGRILRTSFAPDDFPLCYSMNGATNAVTYSSNGLLAPFNNRTIRAVEGAIRDSLTVSAIGRIYRRW